MGYNIGIGEATIEWSPEEDLDDSTVRIGCGRHSDERAVDLGHGDASAKGNFRYPSDSAWANFCKAAGLMDVFYQEDAWRSQIRGERVEEIRGGHPGAVPLTRYHLQRTRDARRKWIAEHPGGRCPSDVPCPDREAGKSTLRDCTCDVDWTLGRLNWLEFWMAWALENCEKPVVFNS